MSKPLYMQLADLRDELNEERRHRANVVEDFQALQTVLRSVRGDLEAVLSSDGAWLEGSPASITTLLRHALDKLKNQSFS